MPISVKLEVQAICCYSSVQIVPGVHIPANSSQGQIVAKTSTATSQTLQISVSILNANVRLVKVQSSFQNAFTGLTVHKPETTL